MLRKIKKTFVYRKIEALTPGFIRELVKRVFWKIVRCYNRFKYIETGKLVGFGYGFRFDHSKPHRVRVGERTVTDSFNVWNADLGDVTVGKECWFGLNNIVMGPVQIGDDHRKRCVDKLGFNNPIWSKHRGQCHYQRRFGCNE